MKTKSIVDIDLSRLDEEWLAQASLFYEWATKLADAKADMATAKAKLELVEAELKQAIRESPSEYNISKTSNDSVNECCLIQPEYQTALAAYNATRSDVDHLDAAVSALDHRKKALENLVYLHGQSYFSAPRGPQEVQKKMDEKGADKAFKVEGMNGKRKKVSIK